MASMALSSKIEIVGRDCDRQTRQAGNIVVTLRRTRSAQKSLFYEGMKMYNSLPIKIKQCNKIVSFKRLLREYILGNV